jgi:glycosyltransferase involved in cell wall biosynthesis
MHLHSTLGVYGAERWTLALLKHLDQKKFEPFVVSIGTKHGADSFYRLLTAEGFAAYHIPVPGKLNPRAILKLRRFMMQQDIDILHTHGFKADVLGYLSTRGLSIRLVSTIHGWSADESFLIRVYEAISRAFLKRFDRVYPLSPALQQHLRQHGFDPHKLHLILNSVDLSGLDFKFNPRRPEDLFSILFVGRIYRPKGVYDLVQAFGIAKLAAPSRLVIVGDGEERAGLEELVHRLGIEDRVTLVGEVSSITRFLAESHALVLPSYAEGIPRVIMEAFAAGVPVIGTAIPGIKQLIEDKVSGLLVPVGKPDLLARTLERLCDNPGLAQRMAGNARQVVTETYSAGRMAHDLQKEYRRLC